MIPVLGGLQVSLRENTSSFDSVPLALRPPRDNPVYHVERIREGDVPSDSRRR